MKFDTKNISSKLQSYLSMLKKYVVFVFAITILLIFSFFVVRINQISRSEPTEQQIEEKLQTVQRPRIDQAVLDKIEELQGQNIEVKSLFDQARNNPFSE